MKNGLHIPFETVIKFLAILSLPIATFTFLTFYNVVTKPILWIDYSYHLAQTFLLMKHGLFEAANEWHCCYKNFYPAWDNPPIGKIPYYFVSLIFNDEKIGTVVLMLSILGFLFFLFRKINKKYGILLYVFFISSHPISISVISGGRLNEFMAIFFGALAVYFYFTSGNNLSRKLAACSLYRFCHNLRSEFFS